jgi:hypothetical protein
VVFAKTLYASTKAYSDNKKCWAPGGARPSLSSVPQLRVRGGLEWGQTGSHWGATHTGLENEGLED